jgi:hypothetical protein
MTSREGTPDPKHSDKNEQDKMKVFQVENESGKCT